MGEVVALLGAAGKMGTRISSNLAKTTTYEVLCVEATGAGEERLRAHGFAPVLLWDAVPRADIVVMAIPDVLISSMTRTIVPQMKSGAMLLCLDPAAPYSGGILLRDDIAYFVTHPCHPSIIYVDRVCIPWDGSHPGLCRCRLCGRGYGTFEFQLPRSSCEWSTYETTGDV